MPGVDRLADVIAALGTAEFAGRLLGALNRHAAIDHLAIMRFEDRRRPPVIESAVWRGGELVASTQRAYLDRFYRYDPVLRCFDTGPRLLHLRRDDIEHRDYRETVYGQAGLLERISITTRDGGQLIALNLYRREPSGSFTPAEVRLVDGQMALLAAMTVKHVRILAMMLRSRDRGDRASALAERLRALEPNLTRRELDVLTRSLGGMTSTGIAGDLGISLNTVLTYRKRAYARLGVCSQAELFSRCFGT